MDVIERPIPRHSPSDEKWFWDSPRPRQLDVDGEMLLGLDLSNRSASDLLQNCDLPPPVKLFPLADHGGGDHSHGAAAEERKFNVEVAGQWDGQLGPAENTRLLRALRLSQTRAREAERKAAEESCRRQELSKLLLEEALRLSSYRRWAMLLEAEISVLRKEGLAPGPTEDKEEEEEEEEVVAVASATAAAWWLTLALCIGIAGVGFVMGRYML